MIKNFFKKTDKNLLILAVLFIIFTPIFLTPVIYGYDGPGYYVYLRSLVIDNDLDFENEYEHYKEVYPYINVRTSETTGKVINEYTIGTALFWSPFFLLAHLSNGDGYSYAYVLLTMIGSALYAFIGLCLMYKLTSKFVKKQFALIGIIIFWLSSHLFYYMYLQPSMSHAISFFTISLFLYYWFFYIKDKPNLKNWIILGIIAALMFLVRIQNTFYLIIPAIYFGIDFFKKKRYFKGPILSAITFFILITPQLLLWEYLTGTFNLLATRSTRTGNPNLVNMFKILFSSHQGLFIWTPVFLLGAIGLYLLYKKNKQLILTFTIAILIQLFLVSGQLNWFGGVSYGNRFMLGTSVFFIIGFAYLLEKIQKKWLIGIICALLIAWNFNLMLQYGSGIICASCAATPLEIIKNTFTKSLPRLFNILKNFLFNRGSFL